MLLTAVARLLSPWLEPGQQDAVPDPLELTGATADSRQVKPGMLFCAIKGAVTDGNRFTAAAIAAGAAAIVSDAPAGAALPVPTLRLRPGTGYPAVARIAAAFAGNPAGRLRLFGVTGTCGKTTTAYLLRDIFRRAGFRTGMIGTVVYDTGARELPADRTTPTPFLLQELLSEMAANGVTHVVAEVSSAALDQERFGDALFAGAVFTNFSRDHLDYHRDMESYFAAKCKLFTDFLAPGAPAVINRDDPWGQRLADMLRQSGGPNVLEFSPDDAADCPTRLPGEYNRYNVAAAATLATAAGVPRPAIREALAASAGAPGRLQRIDCPNGAAAFIVYAHTPEEIAKALSALRPLCRGRLAILFGCGGDRDRGKRPQMAAAAAQGADVLWVTSDNPRTEDPAAIIADVLAGIPANRSDVHTEPDRRLAVRQAVAALAPGDFLLLAGKGHEDYQEINHVKHPMSDLELVREALAALAPSAGGVP